MNWHCSLTQNDVLSVIFAPLTMMPRCSAAKIVYAYRPLLASALLCRSVMQGNPHKKQIAFYHRVRISLCASVSRLPKSFCGLKALQATWLSEEGSLAFSSKFAKLQLRGTAYRLGALDAYALCPLVWSLFLAADSEGIGASLQLTHNSRIECRHQCQRKLLRIKRNTQHCRF